MGQRCGVNFWSGLQTRLTARLLQIWEGDGVVASARKLIGATNPLNAEPGTIRGDLAGQAANLLLLAQLLQGYCMSRNLSLLSET